jgi:hypothetical protein
LVGGDGFDSRRLHEAPGSRKRAGRFLVPGDRIVEPASAAPRSGASRLGFASRAGSLQPHQAPFGRLRERGAPPQGFPRCLTVTWRLPEAGARCHERGRRSAHGPLGQSWAESILPRQVRGAKYPQFNMMRRLSGTIKFPQGQPFRAFLIDSGNCQVTGIVHPFGCQSYRRARETNDEQESPGGRGCGTTGFSEHWSLACWRTRPFRSRSLSWARRKGSHWAREEGRRPLRPLPRRDSCDGYVSVLRPCLPLPVVLTDRTSPVPNLMSV